MPKTSSPPAENHQVVTFQKTRKKQVAPSEISSKNPPRFIRKKEVKERTGIGADSTLYDMISKKRFPAPLHIHGGRSAFWLESEVSTWIDNVLAAAGKEVAS